MDYKEHVMQLKQKVDGFIDHVNSLGNECAYTDSMIEEILKSATSLEEYFQENEHCDHDFFLASQSVELCKPLGYYCMWKHYKIGTLVCSKCGETKQIELDVHERKH